VAVAVVVGAAEAAAEVVIAKEGLPTARTSLAQVAAVVVIKEEVVATMPLQIAMVAEVVDATRAEEVAEVAMAARQEVVVIATAAALAVTDMAVLAVAVINMVEAPQVVTATAAPAAVAVIATAAPLEVVEIVMAAPHVAAISTVLAQQEHQLLLMTRTAVAAQPVLAIKPITEVAAAVTKAVTLLDQGAVVEPLVIRLPS